MIYQINERAIVATETVDPRFVDIDLWSTESAIAAMVEGQLSAVAAVQTQMRAMALAGDAAAARLSRGGRLVYVGAGTSGRVAMQDGVELTPTFDWPGERLVFLMAGGAGALTESAEGAEDDAAAGRAGIAAAAVGPLDVVIGVAASGRTPYTVAAVGAARTAGALTLGVANNPGSALLTASEHPILLETGSEVIAGSTRMKAGTAQKVALNILSTAMMLRIGRVHEGLMVNMRISNEKLLKRGQEMVAQIAQAPLAIAAAALETTGRDIKMAVFVATGTDAGTADALLADHQDNLRAALAARAELSHVG